MLGDDQRTGEGGLFADTGITFGRWPDGNDAGGRNDYWLSDEADGDNGMYAPPLVAEHWHVAERSSLGDEGAPDC